jgi:hypothetical protein
MSSLPALGAAFLLVFARTRKFRRTHYRAVAIGYIMRLRRVVGRPPPV